METLSKFAFGYVKNELELIRSLWKDAFLPLEYLLS